MEFVIVTGLSGTGKSHAASILEDMGFFCVDNMPIPLIPKFTQLGTSNSQYQRVALVADIRAGHAFPQLLEAVEQLRSQDYPCTILYLDAEDQTIVTRYKETRRNHPLAAETQDLLGAIAKEREILAPAKAKADYIMNTSILSFAKLKGELHQLFAGGNLEKNQLLLRFSSFGFKHGLPIDADLVFDVRFLPNPFYLPELRPKTGLDQEVRDYVYKGGQAQEFFTRLEDLLSWLLPHYLEEGKHSLVVAIGCTGGHHRSVTLAHLLAQHYTQQGYTVSESHRDLGRL